MAARSTLGRLLRLVLAGLEPACRKQRVLRCLAPVLMLGGASWPPERPVTCPPDGGDAPSRPLTHWSCTAVLGGGWCRLVPPFKIRHATLCTARLLQHAAFHGGAWLRAAPFPHLPRVGRKSAWLLQISVYPSIHIYPES